MRLSTSSRTVRSLLLLVPVVVAGASAQACSNLTQPPSPEPISSEQPTAATVKPSAAPSASAAPTPSALAAAANEKVTIQDIAPGKGKDVVKAGDKVEVLYKGSLTNGTVFDQSSDHGNKPLPFTVGSGVIKGFSDGVTGMKLGGKRKVTIPPSLGYGNAPAGKIPPNSTLVFEIELVKLNGQSK